MTDCFVGIAPTHQEVKPLQSAETPLGMLWIMDPLTRAEGGLPHEQQTAEGTARAWAVTR